MSKTYESLEPQGHFNFAKRVFQKIKGYIDSKSTSMTLDNYNALTPAQKNDGTIRFIPASSSSGTSTAFDMSGITSYKEYNMSIAATSSAETNVAWDGGNAIGCNWNYTTQIDVTNISAISFTVTNGSCYGGGAQAQQTRWDVQIGLMATPPTSVINVLPSDSSWAVVADMPLSNHTYEETLDVSGLSGNYYIVCFAHGWNTTIEDIVFRSGEGYSSQIKYMSETYGNNINDVMVNGVSVIDTNKIAQITETDQNVLQTQDNSTNNNFEILLAGSTSTSTATEGAKKTNSLIFNPSQQAITIGSRKSGSTIGLTSFASGYYVEASQSCAHAEGYNTKASGDSTHAEGGGTEASGSCAHAEGSATKASGNYAHAEGSITKASGNNAHAEGNNTEASGLYSHAEGGSTKASGSQSHAEGYNTVANHKSQHVFGEYNIADPSAATATDKGNYVEIVGNGTSSTRSNARTLDWNGNEVLSGKLTVGTAPTNNMDVATKLYVDTGLASKQDALTAGSNITIDANNEISATDTTYTAGTGINIDANNVISATGGGTITDVQVNGTSVVSGGIAQITETDQNVLQTEASSSDDNNYEILFSDSTSNTTITDSTQKSSNFKFNPKKASLSIGNSSALGNCSVAEGSGAWAEGASAHAEGGGTEAMGDYSHTEGYHTTTMSQYAHAEGLSTEAMGQCAHVEGYYNIANHRSQHVFGECNIADSSTATASDRGNYVEIVGNGTENTRSNARTLDWDGNEWLAGKLTVGVAPTNNMDVATKQYADSKVAKSGDTMTGRLVMVGSASSQPLQTRGIVGSSTDGTALDGLYLQYGNTTNDAILLGQTAGGSITDNGKLYSGASALNVLKSGDTMSGSLTFSAGAVKKAGGNISWIKGRDAAPVRTTSGSANWNPVASAKSVNGSWEIGTLNDTFYFSYATDTNYNNNTNTTSTISLDSSGNFSGSAAKLNGYASDTAATASTIVRRTADKYIYATYYNSNISNENINSYTNDVAVMFTSNDKWIRRTSRLHFAQYLTNQQVASPGYFVTLTSSWGSFGYSSIAQAQTALGLSTSSGSLSVTYNSTNATTNNDMWYAKYGNVVQLCGSVKNKNAITIPSHGDLGDIEMFTLPSGYRPKITTGGIADNGNLVSWRIASDGKVYLTGVYRSTGTWAAGAVFGIRATFIV